MARTKQATKGKPSESKQLRKKLTTKRNSLGKSNILSRSISITNDSAASSSNAPADQTSRSLPTVVNQSSDEVTPASSPDSASNEGLITPGYARKSFLLIRGKGPYSARKTFHSPPSTSKSSETPAVPRVRTRSLGLGNESIHTTALGSPEKNKISKTPQPLRRSLRNSEVEVAASSTPSTVSKSKTPKSKRVYLAPRVTKRRKPGTLALQEIRYYQKHADLLMRKLPFQRLIKEILHGRKNDFCIRRDAISALQEAAEMYLVDMFERSNLCSIHDKRVTLFVKDMLLVKTLNP